jgi:hypothetical protein
MTLRDLAAVTVLIISVISPGCARKRPPPLAPPKVTPLDVQIAEESAALVQRTLSTLSEDHEIVQRYGRFVAMETSPVQRMAQVAAPQGPGGFPAHLKLECRCTFERFPGTIAVVILPGDEGTLPQFYGQPTDFVMEPSTEAVTTGVLSDCRPLLKGSQLWYVRQGGDQAQVRCTLDCWIKHPAFVP